MLKFNQFEINPNTRELFFGGEIVQIQNKSLELLLYLIQHKDRAVAKDELLEKLWDGRVVSESVLAHASTKLRAALNDQKGKGEIIRTVYGFGLQFVGKLEGQACQSPESQVPETHTKTEVKTKSHFKALLLSFGLMISASVYFLFDHFNSAEPLTSVATETPVDSVEHIDDKPKPKMNFIVGDLAEQQDAWLLQGLTLYLNQLLVFSDNSMPLSLDQLPHNALSAQQFYAMPQVVTTNQINDQFILNLKQEPELKVSAANLYQSINQINKWACATLLNTDKPSTSQQSCETNIRQLTVDNSYLLESYLRGQAAMINLSPKQAIKFFEVTLQQDKDFILARLAIAQAYNQLSEYNKAISHAQTALATSDNTQVQHHANLIIGGAYFRQSEFDKANHALNQVVNSTTSAMSLKAMALLLMSEVSMETDDLAKSFSLAEKSHDMVKQLDLPIMVGQTLDVMGTIKMTMGELESAEQFLTAALRVFEQLSYYAGMEKVLSPLGLVMQSQGLLEASLTYGVQRQKIAEKIGDPIKIAGAHLHLANLLLEMGDYESAMMHANNMWDIVIKEDEPAAVLLAYFIAGEIARADNKLLLSLEKYKHALDLAYQLEIQFRQVQILCTLGATAIDAELFEEAKSYLDDCGALANQSNDKLFQVVSKLYLSQLYKAQKQTDKSRSVLNQALSLSMNMENDHLLWEIYLELFDHYIDSDLVKAEKYLLSIPEGYKDDYVYMVNLARIDYKRNKSASALQLMLEAKQVAKDNWSNDDQLFLDKIASEIQN